MEFLCGEAAAPETAKLLLVERFLAGNVDHIAIIRQSAFKLPFLWRPIRLAINNRGQLGLQFKNRLTGAQEGMFFADERSAFTELLSSVQVTAEDASRLQRGISSDLRDD